MTLAQPVSISYRLGPCEPIIRADNDPTAWGGGLAGDVGAAPPTTTMPAVLDSRHVRAIPWPSGRWRARRRIDTGHAGRLYGRERARHSGA